MKVVKTSCCREIAVNLFKGNLECNGLEFVRHVYWISLVCLSGLYTGSSTPHHSASVELLSSTPNLASASTTDLPPRQHRLDRDLGSPHHLSPLAAMDSTREGWVFVDALTRRYPAVQMCHASSDTGCHCKSKNQNCARRVGNKCSKSVHFLINEWNILWTLCHNPVKLYKTSPGCMAKYVRWGHVMLLTRKMYLFPKTANG